MVGMFTFWIAMAVLVAVGAAAVMLVSWRLGPDPEAMTGVRVAKVTRLVAWLYAATCTVGGVSAAASTLWGRDVTVKLPVQQFWPKLPDSVNIQTPLAVVEAGGFSQAEVSASGLDMVTRLWLAGGVLTQMAVAVVVGLVVATVCTSLMKKSFFAPKLVRGVRRVAAVVLVGGLGWQVCQIFGGTLAAERVLGATAWGQTGESVAWTDLHTIIGLPSVAYEWEFNFWPIAVALVLVVLAELFRHGSKVQEDAVGLV